MALTIDGTGDTTISGIVSGSGTITKAGNGTLTLSGANTYSGATTLSAGTLNINNATALRHEHLYYQRRHNRQYDCRGDHNDK